MALCGNCFRDIGNNSVCTFCGYDAAADREKYAVALHGGSVLGGRYIVGRVLGQGGFGITYSALDYESKKLVAIKEHFPASLVTRTGTSEVRLVSSGMVEAFNEGKEKFLAEARTISQFNGQPNICDIYSYFEENGTAYFAMEYVDGIPLDNYMKKLGRLLSFEEALRLLLPVMKALSRIHAAGIIHRDLAPDNIMVTPYNGVMLIDFGAARYSMGEMSRSLDVILKHGFAPKEQYARRSRQGAYTDVYAFAATFYYTITGKVPPDAIERSDEDELVPPSKLGIAIPHRAEQVLLKALAVDYKNRFQTMDEFIQKFSPFLPDLKREMEERQASQRRAEAEKRDAERKAQQEKRKAEAEKREAERKIQEEKRAAERKAEEERRAEERKALEAKREAERIAAEERRQAEKRIQDAKREADKKAQEEARKAREEAKAEALRLKAEAKAVKKNKPAKADEAVSSKPKKRGGRTAAAVLGIFLAAILGTAFYFRADILFGLGWLYDSGTKLEQDYSKAFELYVKSADLGHDMAMNNLGYLYENGYGTEKDLSAAFEWYKKSAEAGNGLGMCNLGWMYMNGYGCERNYEAAFEWCLKSAELGEPSGMNNLGHLYNNGFGTAENPDAAYYWYSKAAELGSELAAENLALLLQGGYEPPETLSLDGPAPTQAPATPEPTEISWELSDDGTLTISGTGKMEDYSNKIPAPWFSGSLIQNEQRIVDSNIRRVVISEGISYIGNRAFYNCAALSEVIIPESVESIGDEAFRDCVELSSVELPARLTSMGKNVFRGCYTLSSISVPHGVTDIGYAAFYGCNSLESISIPASVSRIDDLAFSICLNLKDVEYSGTQEQWNGISIGNDNEPLLNANINTAIAAGKAGENAYWTLDEYGTLTFSGYGAMSNYGVTNLANGRLQGTAPWCSEELINSVRTVVIEPGITSVGQCAFLNCFELRKVSFPVGLESIGSQAFHCCDGLSEISFQEGLKKIGGYAFNSCRYIRKVTLPASLEKIGEGAFQFCNALGTVEFMGSVEQWNKIDIKSDRNEDLLEASINFAYISAGDCGENVRWGLDEYGTLTISGKGAVTDCTWFDLSPLPEIRRVVIEPGITHVADFAFNGFDSLAEVQLPEGLKSIGDAAFNMCHSLRSIKIPEGVEVIPRSLFYNCNNLQSVELPSTLKTIEGRAFMGCSSLSRISIPEGLETISVYAFYNCRNFQSVELPSTLKTIQDFAFSDSNNIWVYYAGTEQQWNEIEVGKYCLPRFTISFEQ